MSWRLVARVIGGTGLAAGLWLAPLSTATAQLAPGPKATGAADAASGVPVRRSDEREAARLLVEAEAELIQGDRRVGARMLELIVARYPETLAADRARGRLQALQQPTKQPPGQPAAPAAKPGGLATVSGGATAWRARVRVARTAAEEFRQRAADRVFFSERSAELGSRARVVLASQAAWLKANPTAPVVVEAHADDPGTPLENMELAARRGEAVKTRLIEEGVGAARIRVAVIGMRVRAASCAETICAAQNRRVVTLIALRSPNEGPGPGLAGTIIPPQPVPALRPAPLPGMNGLGGPAAGTAPR